MNLVLKLKDEDQSWYFKDIDNFQWTDGALEIKGQRRYYWEQDLDNKAIVDMTFQPVHQVYPPGTIESIEWQDAKPSQQ